MNKSIRFILLLATTLFAVQALLAAEPVNYYNNAKGKSDDFEIDIVAETVEGEVEAYEVKRNPQRYNPVRLREKVEVMQRHLYRGREVKMCGVSMEEM